MYLGAVRPLMGRHATATARQADLDAANSRLRQMEADAAVLRSKLESVRQALARNPLHLEPASAVNRRLAEISSLAGENGLKVNEIAPGQTEIGAYYNTIPIYLSGSGNYRTCTVFLHELRKQLPDMGISSLELTGVTGREGSVGLFRFALLWQAAPAVEGAMK
jgi:Tfp pilus assembly protein PilO